MSVEECGDYPPTGSTAASALPGRRVGPLRLDGGLRRLPLKGGVIAEGEG